MSVQDDSGGNSEDSMRMFYRSAFWWMMGICGSGIAGSLVMAIQLNVAVGRLDVQIQNVVSNYATLAATFERASGDRYTGTTAAADKLELASRLEAMERRLSAAESAVVELRIWRASHGDHPKHAQSTPNNQ